MTPSTTIRQDLTDDGNVIPHGVKGIQLFQSMVGKTSRGLIQNRVPMRLQLPQDWNDTMVDHGRHGINHEGMKKGFIPRPTGIPTEFMCRYSSHGGSPLNVPLRGPQGFYENPQYIIILKDNPQDKV